MFIRMQNTSFEYILPRRAAVYPVRSVKIIRYNRRLADAASVNTHFHTCLSKHFGQIIGAWTVARSLFQIVDATMLKALAPHTVRVVGGPINHKSHALPLGFLPWILFQGITKARVWLGRFVRIQQAYSYIVYMTVRRLDQYGKLAFGNNNNNNNNSIAVSRVVSVTNAMIVGDNQSRLQHTS